MTSLKSVKDSIDTRLPIKIVPPPTLLGVLRQKAAKDGR